APASLLFGAERPNNLIENWLTIGLLIGLSQQQHHVNFIICQQADHLAKGRFIEPYTGEIHRGSTTHSRQIVDRRGLDGTDIYITKRSSIALDQILHQLLSLRRGV